MVNKCIIALGSNQGTSTQTPVEVLEYALRLLKVESCDLGEVSSWYQTPAFPAGSGPSFVNAVATLTTDLTPQNLLDTLSAIENTIGRIREKRWGPRVIDLDLIAFNDLILPDLGGYSRWKDLPLEMQTVETPQELILPHPRVQDRAFVLIPLRDVSPDWIHPVSGASLDEMIADLDPEEVKEVKPLG